MLGEAIMNALEHLLIQMSVYTHIETLAHLAGICDIMNQFSSTSTVQNDEI